MRFVLIFLIKLTNTILEWAIYFPCKYLFIFLEIKLSTQEKKTKQKKNKQKLFRRHKLSKQAFLMIFKGMSKSIKISELLTVSLSLQKHLKCWLEFSTGNKSSFLNPKLLSYFLNYTRDAVAASHSICLQSGWLPEHQLCWHHQK